jgi:hypothetical protein
MPSPFPFKPKYPKASIFIDAKVAYLSTLNWSCKEIGLLFKELSKNLLLGNFEKVKELPFVVRIEKGVHLRRYISKEVRRKVLSAGQCLKCGTNKKLTVDHIIPLSAGGKNSEDNLQCLCFFCNRKKGPERG